MGRQRSRPRRRNTRITVSPNIHYPKRMDWKDEVALIKDDKEITNYLNKGYVLSGGSHRQKKDAERIREQQLGDRFYYRIIYSNKTHRYYLLQKKK